MKIKLFKVASMLLFAALFAVPACTDYSADIAEVKGDVKSLQSSLSTLESSVSSLQTTVSGLQTQLTATEKKLSESISALEKNFTEALAKQKTELEAQVTTLKGLIDEANTEIEEAKADIAVIKSRLYEDEADIQRNADGIKALQALIDEHLILINNLTARVDALEADVATLFARLQSVVFMPERTDGGANLNILAILKNKVDAKTKAVTEYYDYSEPALSYFDFMVTPAEQAANIVALYEKGEVKLDFTAVKTKADVYADTLYKLDVKAATLKDAAKGIVTVSVLPTIKDVDKLTFTDKRNKSVSLVVKNASESAEVASSFFQTFVNFTYLRLGGLGMRDENGIYITTNYKENAYNVTDEFTQFNGYEPLFYATGSKAYLLSEIKTAFGVDIPVTYYLVPKFRKYFGTKEGEEIALGKELIDLFKVNEVADTAKFIEKLPTFTVQLDPASAEADRKELAVLKAYEQTHVGVCLDSSTYVVAEAIFQITKAKVEETATCETAEWNYEDDFNSDLRWTVENPHIYGRSELHLTFEDWAATIAKLETLGLNIVEAGQETYGATVKIYDAKGKVGSLDYDPNVSVKLGKKAESNHFTWYDGTNGFYFGNKYAITCTISNDFLEFVVNFDFKTTDRNRALMAVTVADSEYVYKAGNEIKYTQGILDSLWDIASDRKFYTLYGFKEANFKAALGSDYTSQRGFSVPTTWWDPTVGTMGICIPSAAPKADSLGFVPCVLKDTLKVNLDWRQDFNVAWTVKYTVPDFDIDAIESGAVQYDSEAEVPHYYVQAVGDYIEGPTKKLNKFEVLPIELDNIFKESKDGKILTPAAAKAFGLDHEFSVLPEYGVITDANFTFKPGVVEAPVHATLTIEGDGTYVDEFVIPSNFEKGGIYETFTVKNANPIAVWEPIETDTTVYVYASALSQDTYYPAYSNFVMRDTKGHRILWEAEGFYYNKKDSSDVGRYADPHDSPYAFSKSDFGDDPQDVYGNGLTDIKYELMGVPAGLEENVKMTDDGRIVISGLNTTAQSFTVQYRAWVGSDYYGKYDAEGNKLGQYTDWVTLTISVEQ